VESGGSRPQSSCCGLARPENPQERNRGQSIADIRVIRPHYLLEPRPRLLEAPKTRRCRPRAPAPNGIASSVRRASCIAARLRQPVSSRAAGRNNPALLPFPTTQAGCDEHEGEQRSFRFAARSFLPFPPSLHPHGVPASPGVVTHARCSTLLNLQHPLPQSIAVTVSFALFSSSHCPLPLSVLLQEPAHGRPLVL
jgi:hypothetical protein